MKTDECKKIYHQNKEQKSSKNKISDFDIQLIKLLDSRIQEVSDIGFNTTVSNVAVTAAPYRVWRVQVPVEQIAWDVSTTALAGNPNVCVRRDNVPAEFDNDAFSEVAGSATDSVTLVPNALTDGTWFLLPRGRRNNLSSRSARWCRRTCWRR